MEAGRKVKRAKRWLRLGRHRAHTRPDVEQPRKPQSVYRHTELFVPLQLKSVLKPSSSASPLGSRASSVGDSPRRRSRLSPDRESKRQPSKLKSHRRESESSPTAPCPRAVTVLGLQALRSKERLLELLLRQHDVLLSRTCSRKPLKSGGFMVWALSQELHFVIPEDGNDEGTLGLHWQCKNLLTDLITVINRVECDRREILSPR